MATTANGILPRTGKEGHPPSRKPMSKAHKAKLRAALANWRASLTDEEREALKERNRQTHQERWAGMTKKERDAGLAGVRKWQAEQRAAKRVAPKAKPAPKIDPKKAPAKRSRAASVGERTARNGTVKPLAESTRPLEADLELREVSE